MSERCKVENSSREIIANRLLLALNESKDVVAILAPKGDLDLLIAGLKNIKGLDDRGIDLLEDLKQLRDAAFPASKDLPSQTPGEKKRKPKL